MWVTRPSFATGEQRAANDPSAAAEGTTLLESACRAAAQLGVLSVEDLGSESLLDRFDTKFILPAALIPAIIGRCAGDYRVVTAAGARICSYRTVYLDTADFALYHAHHRGQLPRYKVRVRTYVDTDDHFLEVKRKTNSGRTTKWRSRIANERWAGGGQAPPDLPVEMEVPSWVLLDSVTVCYARLSLANANGTERVTLDWDIGFTNREANAGYPSLAIAEVKQPRRGPSPFLNTMSRLRRRKTGVSKYCLGVATLHPAAKGNHFRRLLSQVRRTADYDAISARTA